MIIYTRLHGQVRTLKSSRSKRACGKEEAADAGVYAPIFLAVEPRFGNVQGSGQTIYYTALVESASVSWWAVGVELTSPSLYAQKYAIMPMM